MLKKGLFALAASSLLASAAFAYPQIMTLDQLKARCHEFEANGQILPFSSSFTCSEERTFWVPKGVQQIPLLNGSEIRVRALIKDGAHDTDWWVIPQPVKEQYGSCEIVEQWRSTARATLTFRSCAELDLIVDEASFCKSSLAQVWSDCDAEHLHFQQAGSSSSSSSAIGFKQPGGACEYVPTGIVKGCVGGGEPLPPPPPVCDTSSESSCSSESLSHSSLSSQSCDSSLSSSDCVPGPAPILAGPEPYAYELGADVYPSYVKKGPFKVRYEVLELQNDPKPGSMLHKAGFKKGDVINKINGRRIRSGAELQQKLAAAKKSGTVKVSYRDARGKFVDKNLSNF